ncbi:hypothetical protein IC229_02755 [Spirosoma sp. BT702]|uniref:Uncharacterized protein n=1 Tax=Spirosoma profusum TaxID=2771354 RepID=A0A927ARC9_9BACT|nr:hypothetical protein [Spirosoma profusum]MBD2699540.1 hypothetical protein [Spirosoma profusum]
MKKKLQKLTLKADQIVVLSKQENANVKAGMPTRTATNTASQPPFCLSYKWGCL